MKIRTDFVTNSSSSSFVTFKITDKRLNNFLVEMLDDDCFIEAPLGTSFTGMGVSLSETEITDFEHDTFESDAHMGSILEALTFYLKLAGCEAIEKKENRDMLELLCDEAEDNCGYDTKYFCADSD